MEFPSVGEISYQGLLGTSQGGSGWLRLLKTLEIPWNFHPHSPSIPEWCQQSQTIPALRVGQPTGPGTTCRVELRNIWGCRNRVWWFLNDFKTINTSRGGVTTAGRSCCVWREKDGKGLGRAGCFCDEIHGIILWLLWSLGHFFPHTLSCWETPTKSIFHVFEPQLWLCWVRLKELCWEWRSEKIPKNFWVSFEVF